MVLYLFSSFIVLYLTFFNDYLGPAEPVRTDYLGPAEQYQSVLQRLQLLQNYAARLVYKIPKFCHITPYLKDLHWLPVQARIQFKLLTIVFKCIRGNGPQYLSELLCRKMTRPGLRSANSIILYIPRTLSRAEQSTADRSFSISGPKLWNQLPVSIQNSCSLDVFKSRLKTFLFKKFFY